MLTRRTPKPKGRFITGQLAGYATARPAPPPPRTYKPVPPSERVAKQPAEATDVTKPRKKPSFIHRLFSTSPRGAEEGALRNEPKDIARGLEASQRVVREGVLDPRYKPAARRVTAIICALPLAIFLGCELFQRRFMGKEQKTMKQLVGEKEGAT